MEENQMNQQNQQTDQQTEQPSTQNPVQNQQPNNAPVNYDEVVKSDKVLQSWFDRKVTEATQNAVRKYQEKMRLINDAAADENSKLSVMTPEQQADYWRQKAEKLARDSEAQEAGRTAKEKAIGIFEKNKIPTSLLDLHDLSKFDDDFTTNLLNIYSQYEFYPKGSFDEAVSKAVAEKLAQSPPESHNPPTKDPYGWVKEKEPAKRQPWERHTNR